MKASHRRILHWALIAVAAVVLVGAFVMANLAAQLSGGWDEVFDRSNPLPGDPKVVAARAVGAAAVDAELDRVVTEVVEPALTEGRVAQPALAGPEAMTDRGIGLDSACEVGFHDWKRDDPYDLLCTEIRRAIVAGDAESFRPDMLALHAALTADGWKPRFESSELPATLDRADELARLSGAQRAAVTNLPAADYRSSDGRFDLELSFQYFTQYTGRPEPELADDEYATMASLSHESFLD